MEFPINKDVPDQGSRSATDPAHDLPPHPARTPTGTTLKWSG